MSNVANKTRWRVTIECFEDGELVSHNMACGDDDDNDDGLPLAIANAVHGATFIGGYGADTQLLRAFGHLSHFAIPQMQALAIAWDAWSPGGDFCGTFTVGINVSLLRDGTPLSELERTSLERAAGIEGVEVVNLPPRSVARNDSTDGYLA